MPPPVSGEVTITCLTDTLHLPDLGLKLTRNARVSVPLSAAMRSRDLTTAKINGTVSTQTLRASVIRVQERVSSDTVTSQSPRASHGPDLSPLVDAIQVLTDEVRGLREDLQQSPHQDMNLAPLVAEIQKLTAVRSTGQSKQPVATQDEVFIPSGITGDSLVVSLEVPTHSTQNQGLEDTAKALKAARKLPR
jgi:hypothetical protein